MYPKNTKRKRLEIKNDLCKIKKVKLYKKTSEKNAVIYCRISSDKQSLHIQEMKCIEYANANKYKVVQIVKETSSARNFDKMIKLKELLDSINNMDIIVYSLDRFCRNTLDMLNILKELNRNNINIISISDNINMSTASGKHAFWQRISAAELESDLISERVNRNIEYKKSMGHIFGIAPYGFSKKTIVLNNSKICKELEENPEEQKIIKIINKISNVILTPSEVTEIISKELNERIYNLGIFEDEIQINNNKKVIIGVETVCDILNSYNLLKRNKLWGKNEVKKYTNCSISMKELELSLNKIMNEMNEIDHDFMEIDNESE